MAFLNSLPDFNDFQRFFLYKVLGNSDFFEKPFGEIFNPTSLRSYRYLF